MWKGNGNSCCLWPNDLLHKSIGAFHDGLAVAEAVKHPCARIPLVGQQLSRGATYCQTYLKFLLLRARTTSLSRHSRLRKASIAPSRKKPGPSLLSNDRLIFTSASSYLLPSSYLPNPSSASFHLALQFRPRSRWHCVRTGCKKNGVSLQYRVFHITVLMVL